MTDKENQIKNNDVYGLQEAVTSYWLQEAASKGLKRDALDFYNDDERLMEIALENLPEPMKNLVISQMGARGSRFA